MYLVSVLLLGCTAKGVINESPDDDADGFLATVDCDDAEATVHPGATEVWYDGIDQDCDGADDDQDGDGFARADDCDDTDAAAHPGAGEVPQDGIDQDCDGTDAPAASVDGDGDGYTASVDCDDADGRVHPGAVDVAGDGVDQDCDGADVADAPDADNDGYTAVVDCDEADPEIHPGAVDAPGDGIDQDCDGADDLVAADGDGDGWASTAFGGPDCDDADAGVHPGATEVVGDDVDSDCDGADYGVSGLEVGDLVVTEIMYDPDAVGDGSGEWFELYNGTGHTVNLRDLVVADDVAFAAADSFVVDLDLLAEPGARLVFGVDDDPTANGGVTVDFDYPGGGVSFNNSGDDLYIGVDTGSAVTLLDSVAYDEAAGWPLAKGASIELNDTKVTASGNDSAASWCLATGVAGSTSDKGSPGKISSGC